MVEEHVPEEQKDETVTDEKASDQKAIDEKVNDVKTDEIKENGSPDERPAENGDEKKDDTTKDKKTEKEKDKDDGDMDEDGESSDEEELGSLEKPVEILTTKRERKSVEVYVVEKKEEEKKEGLDYSKGKGVKLGDIPIVKHNVNRADTEDLQVLHRMMYRRAGKQHNTKKNIREFCGWPFEKDSKEYKSVRSNIIDRLITTALKWTLNLLGLDKSGKNNDEMRDILCAFLLEPEMNETKVADRKSGGGSKRSSGKKSTPKRKSTPKGKSKKKSKDSGDDDDADDDDVSDVSEASDDNESGSEEEEKEEKPKKKTPQPKKSPKKKAKATPVKIAIPAKKKSASKKRKADESETSEDEEPLSKKSNVPPTDAELKKVVSAILKDADLEEVTMKSVVRQVYDKYSSFDLSSRKDFIKVTVKELIS